MNRFAAFLGRHSSAFRPRRRKARQKWAGRLTESAVTVGLTLALSASALANPTGPTVRHGQVNISPGAQAQIQQLTDKAIIDWQSFSIDANESVRFLQPGQLSVVLNRVTGADVSQILGQLEANGQVFLINPNGILFGPNSVVNVGSLVASTLSLSDEDFLAGNYNFTQDMSRDLAAVVNQGKITVVDGGYAVLTGPSVINEGTIVARTGHVRLAAGEKATLNLDGRDLVHFSLDGQVTDGTVLLAPGMMSDVIAQTLGVDRALRADKLIRMDDGSVKMVSSSGTLVQSGNVSVDGREGQDAGTVRLESTDLTIVAGGSVTSASGQGLASNAGEVVVLSQLDGNYNPMSRTLFQSGALLAAAGGETGDAGFIEVSGEWVDLSGDLDLHRTDGSVGLFLLDPPDVVVVDDTFVDDGRFGTATLVTDAFIETTLAGADFSVQAFTGGSLTLDVRGTSGGADSGIQSGSTNTLTLETPGGTFVDLNTDDVSLGGDFTINSDGETRLGTGSLQVGGNFNISSAGNILFESSQTTVTGDLFAQAGSDVDLGNSQITATSVDIQAQGTELRGDGATIDTRGNPAITTDGGEIALSSQGLINLDNTTLRFANPFGGGGLSITSDSDMLIQNNSLIESETNTSGLFVADITAESISGSILIDDTDVSGAEISLTANDGDISYSGFGVDVTASQNFTSTSNTFTGSTISAGGSVDISATSSLSGQSIDGSDVTLRGGSVDLDNAFVQAATSVTITGDRVSLLGNASVQTSQSPIAGGPILVIPEISITADEFINMGAATAGGLRTARLILETTGTASTDFISVAIDTTRASLADIPTRLTASSQGSIVIRDIAPDPITNFANGIALTRPGGAPGTASTDLAAVRSAESSVTITSAGNLDFGLGDGSTTPDIGASLIQAAGPVDVRALLSMRDRNSTSTSLDTLEVQTTGDIQLIGGSVGEFTGTNVGRIEIDGSALTVRATVVNEPIHVASQDDLNYIDVGTNGGEVLVTENGIVSTTGGSISYRPEVTSGPNVLKIGQNNPIQAATVRFTNQRDTQVDGVRVNAGQTTILRNTNASSLLNGNPTSGNANITNSGTLVLSAEGAVGSLNAPLRIQGNEVSVSGATDIFLNLSPLSPSTSVDLQGVDPAYLATSLASLASTAGSNPENIQVTDLITLEVTGDLNLNSSLYAENGVAITTTGSLNLNQSVGTGRNVLLEADQILNGDNSKISGTGVGLSLGQSFGASNDFIDFFAEQLVLGANPTVDYFLQTGGEGADLTWVERLDVGNKFITGNQVNRLQHTHTDGNIFVNGGLQANDTVVLSATSTSPRNIAVNSTVDATNRAELRATGSITQGTSGARTGLVDSSAVVLDAGADIGDINNDQQINGGTLALSAGNSAFVQDRTGDLEVVGDGTLSRPAGAVQDLRIRVDNGDLTLSNDLAATNAAFVAGTDLTINAQTTGPDIFINGNVTAGQNLVFLAPGDIVSGTGSQIQVTGTSGSLGLGAGGQVGPTNPVNISVPNLALNPANGNIQAATTPTSVATVTAVGVTVNAQTTNPPPTPTPPPTPEPQTVTVTVLLNPSGVNTAGDLFDPAVLAQNNVELVEQNLQQLLQLSALPGEFTDPSWVPTGWWDDEDFMRKKFRR